MAQSIEIWKDCKGHDTVKMLELEPWRIVEAQHILALRPLVDTTQEHDLLEELLENSKPSIDKNTHYLIFTPFRYPSLRDGSRFATRLEPSLWYGSLELDTALSEVAYYRCRFAQDSEAELGYVETQLTAFQSYIKASRGIDLTKKPFDQHQNLLCANDNYQHTQKLGADMRSVNIEAFLFSSARSDFNGTNVGVFTPKAFYQKENKYVFNQQTWQCIANSETVEMVCTQFTQKKHIFTFK